MTTEPTQELQAEQQQQQQLKRPFEEIQSRAFTIHDIAAEDDEDDQEWKETVEVEEVEAEGEDDDDEEDDDEDEDEELEEDVSVEELTEVVKEAGFEVTDLGAKVLRGGKKIATPLESGEVNEVAQNMAGTDSSRVVV